MTIKDKLATLLIGDRLRKVDRLTELLIDEYRSRPVMYDRSPEDLLQKLSEVDSHYVDFLIRQLRDSEIGFMDSTGGNEIQRLASVKECRSLYLNDVITINIIDLWTDYAFGLKPDITLNDKAADEIWTEFWNYPSNQYVLGDKDISDLSTDLLVDGEFYFVIFTSKLDGQSILRTVPTEQITEIIHLPGDSKVPVYYKRTYTGDDYIPSTIYYQDWRASLEDVDKVILPGGSTLANSVRSGDTGTDVLMIQVAFRKRSGRGWPLMSAGAAWSRAYRNFLQDRAAVARKAAMYTDVVTVKGGSRAVSKVISDLQSSLMSSTSPGYETNPAPVAGSDWVQNEAINRQRRDMSTGALDAEKDGSPLLAQAGLAGRVFPHYLGRGEAFRLATACYSDDTEILTFNGWKAHKDWLPGESVACFNRDTQKMVYHIPSEMLVYDIDDVMVHISGRAIDTLVTANHRMLVLNQNNQSRLIRKTEFEVLPADNLPSRFALPTFCPLENSVVLDPPNIGISGFTGNNGHCYPDKTIDIDIMLRFIGWWIAEGWLEKSKKRNNVTVGLAVSELAISDIEDIRCILRQMPFAFNEDKNGSNLRWRCGGRILYQWLLDNIGQGSANKRVPSFVFCLPSTKKRILLDTLWLGDGHSEMQEHYRGFLTTTSKLLADDVLRLILEIGEWGSVSVSYEAGSKTNQNIKTNLTCFVVHRNVIDKRSLSRKRNVSYESYKGNVYCFQVPTGFYITRRNGKPIIAGNTAMEVPILKAFNRYQSFWSSVWRDLVEVVITQHNKYGSTDIEDTTSTINSDAIVQLNINDVKLAVDSVVALSTNMLLSTEEAKYAAGELTRIMLQTLGVVDDPDAKLDQPTEADVQEYVNPDTGKLIPDGQPLDPVKAVLITPADIDHAVDLWKARMPDEYKTLLDAE